MAEDTTPTTGIPPKGWVRVVIDYPRDEHDGPTLSVDRAHFCQVTISPDSNIAARGKLVRLLKNADDAWLPERP